MSRFTGDTFTTGGWAPAPQQQQLQQPTQGNPWDPPGIGGGGGGGAWGGQQQAFSQPFPSSTWAAPPPQQISQQNVGGGTGYDFPINTQSVDPVLSAGLQVGINYGQKMMDEERKKYSSSVSSFWGSLKSYFLVDNAFIIKRLGTVLFPFAKKDWSPAAAIDGNSPTTTTTSNPNRPDLYIPLMALSTYVLVVGLTKGSAMKFDPEVLVNTFSSSFMCVLIQVGIIRGALWFVGPWAPVIPPLDLVAYTGYVFVGVSINMLVGLLFGTFGYRVSLILTGLSASFFMFKTMSGVVPPPDPGQRGKKRRMYFLLTCALLQLITMWFLGYSRELQSTGMFTALSSWDTTGKNADGTSLAGGSARREKIPGDNPPKVPPMRGENDDDDTPPQPVKRKSATQQQQQGRNRNNNNNKATGSGRGNAAAEVDV